VKVLVGYASAHGSTREIAEHLGARLGSHGLDTDVSELARVVDPGRYDAYVLGSAVHDQRWLPEARAFVAEHAPELAAKPVWLFSVGMPAALRFPLTLLAGLQPAALVAEFTDRLSFRDHLVVSGVVRDEHLPLLGQLRQLLRPGGWLVIFEHNPLNPLTRFAVNTCPFDENAVLLSGRTLRRRLQAAGFGDVEIAYTAFFPRALAALRRFERALTWMPVGAQYYAIAHA